MPGPRPQRSSAVLRVPVAGEEVRTVEDGRDVPVLSRPPVPPRLGEDRRARGAVPPARERVIHLGAANVPVFLGKSRLGRVSRPERAGLRFSSDFLGGRRGKRRPSPTVRGGRR